MPQGQLHHRRSPLHGSPLNAPQKANAAAANPFEFRKPAIFNNQQRPRY